MLQRGNSGDGCDLASTLCKHDLRIGDLFVLSWARVKRLRRGSISSELLMCGGGVCSILFLHLVMSFISSICDGPSSQSLYIIRVIFYIVIFLLYKFILIHFKIQPCWFCIYAEL